MSQISEQNPKIPLIHRLRCNLQKNRELSNQIESLVELSVQCCDSSSSSSSSYSSSSSEIPSSSSSSIAPICEFNSNYIYDEWIWNSGTDNGIGEGVNTWEGVRNSKILTTLPGRNDTKRSKVQNNCILINGSPSDKRAYHAFFEDDWYPPAGNQPFVGNALFFIVEIDLFKSGETTLWNHLITGGYDNGYNSFSTQTSTQKIGTRTNGIFNSIDRPAWIQSGVRRYMVEIRYDYAGPGVGYYVHLHLNGQLIQSVASTSALKKILGVGVVAPLDYSANSTLDRRLLSIFALRHPVTNQFGRIPQFIFEQSREYLACQWGVELQS